MKVGDVVEVREKSRAMPMVMQSVESQERDVPDYINFDDTNFKIEIKKIPGLDDVPYPVQMEPNLVIEFYSR